MEAAYSDMYISNYTHRICWASSAPLYLQILKPPPPPNKPVTFTGAPLQHRSRTEPPVLKQGYPENRTCRRGAGWVRCTVKYIAENTSAERACTQTQVYASCCIIVRMLLYTWVRVHTRPTSFLSVFLLLRVPFGKLKPDEHGFVVQ
ncbi:hypothetical protein FKM82_017044 [Ascaphus truei]